MSNPEFGRRSIRLPGYDYAQTGEYFITIRTHECGCVLGTIRNEEMTLSEIGTIVREEWLRTPLVRPNIELDEFIIMPNHVHGIIVIRDERKGGDVFVRAAGGIRMHRAEGTIQIGSTLRVLHSEASSCPYEKVSRRGEKCPFVRPQAR